MFNSALRIFLPSVDIVFILMEYPNIFEEEEKNQRESLLKYVFFVLFLISLIQGCFIVIVMLHLLC